jgi:hypothetical protein
MNKRLLWAAVGLILVVAAVVYFTTSGSMNRVPQDRPTPHAIDQGNG